MSSTMKSAAAVVACLLCLLGVAAAARDYVREEEMALNPVHVRLHNDDLGQTTWMAGESDFFQGKTLQEAKALMGTRLGGGANEGEAVRTFDHIDDGDIPDEFDARAQWPGLIHPIRNQEKCGSCWAFGAVESLGDRFAIATNASSPVLSPEDLVSCDELSLGCLGGFISMAWRYIESVGVVTERCFPYAAGDGNAPPCPPKGQCVSKSAEYKKYRTSDHYRLDTVEDIQKAIIFGGPVEGGFEVHQSFMHYKSGVYSREWWKFWDPELGGHAIKILGWGNQNGTDYWLVANSWGTDWGLDGYFKIKKGVNECDIESSVYAGDPLLA